ncbi:MAG: S-layer homology domain-containing protein, partial [Clostridia bacterium]|nr:S-layer homology domain-containing protein [Clostridia bacterium]
MKTRIIALLLTVAFLISMLPVAVFAETEAVPTLISAGPEVWFEDAMDKAVENGLMIGWNGDLMPGDNLTKAQMATIINRAFGAADMADISACPDVTADDWFYEDMAKAVMMGTVDPDQDGYLYPGEVVTREQVFTALSDAFGFYYGDVSVLEAYTDSDEISEWALNAFASLVGNGYVQGYDGMLNPKGNITRAEFAVVMDNLVKTYIDEAGDYTEDYEGNVMIRVEGARLLNLSIDGDLMIGDGVGDGEVYMEDIEVLGRTLIRGGGRNSILIKGESYLNDIVIKRVNGELRIDGSNDTIMGDVIVDGRNDVILDGFFGIITVLAKDVTVNAARARIGGGEVIGENSLIIVYDYAVVNPGPGMKLLSSPPKPEIIETPAEFFGFDPDTGTILGYNIDGGTDVVVPKKIDGVDVLYI